MTTHLISSASTTRRSRTIQALLGTLAVAALLAADPASARAADPTFSLGGTVQLSVDLDGERGLIQVRSGRDHGAGWQHGYRRDQGPRHRTGGHRRLRTQERRIQAGVQDGSLTRHEARMVQRQHDRVRAYARGIRADGVVTPRERARLDRALDRQSRRIYRERHDWQAGSHRHGPRW